MIHWIFCLAALSPFFQSTRELQTLLHDPRLYESLGNESRIMQIQKIEDGYRIYTQNKSVDVFVIYQSNGSTKQVGPIPFELQFGRSAAQG